MSLLKLSLFTLASRYACWLYYGGNAERTDPGIRSADA